MPARISAAGPGAKVADTGSAAPSDAECPVLNAAVEVLRPALDGGRGDAPAVLFGEDSLSFAELDRLSVRFARAFKAAGLHPGERVLFLMLDKPDLVGAFLGVVRAGGVAVLANVRAAASDLAFFVEDSGCRILLIDPLFVPVLREARGHLAAADAPALCVLSDGLGPQPPAPAAEALTPMAEFLAAGDGEPADAPTDADTGPDDMAFWLYTSGTTGRPKAAVHRHRAVLGGERFLADVLGIGPGDRVFCSSKLFFAFSLGHGLLGGLRRGAALVLYEGWPSSEAIARVIERHRPTAVFSVPTFYRNLLREGVAVHDAFREVETYVASGEKLPEDLFASWFAATGRPILEGVGSTETLFLFLANTPDGPRPGSCGHPTPGSEVRLLDEAGNPVVAPGLPGRLWVRMESLAAGYWNQPQATAECFRDGWYGSGDLFALDDAGAFHHHGRGDDMIKVSGQWVSPAEIEEETRAEPGVIDAAVVGVANQDGLTRLALFVVPLDPEASRPALAARIQERLTGRLSVYKCPRRVLFLDDLPRTPSGKVHRFMLRQLAADQVGSRA